MNTHRLARAAITTALVLFGMGLLVPMQAHGFTAGHRTSGPVLIGEIIPLTGPDAAGPGLYEGSGAKLAVREINAHGGVNGRPLKLVLADDRSTPTGAIAAFGRLVKVGHITAVIATAGSQKNQAMAPSIKKAGIPVIIGVGTETMFHEGDPWVFATLPSGIYSTRALSAFTVSTLHQSRVAVLYGNAIATTQGNARLLTDLKALGVTPLVDQAIPTYPADLTAQVLAIKKSGAAALISLPASIEAPLLLARQMHQVGLHPTWVGNLDLSVEKLVWEGGALLYGTYAVTPYAPDQSPEALAFHRYSEATLHLPGDYVSGYAYDGVQILAKVMRKVGANPQAIRQGILAIRGYHGVMGTYNFDKHGESLRQETVVQNVRGRLRVIKVLTF
jgi:branched-chain amino acid transport system substrate-binding protein